MDKDNQIVAAVNAALKALEHFRSLTSEDDDCTLCNNAQWWIDNGFTEAERRAFCNSIGCPIPPAAA